jgi:Uma2 family endonuclease
MLDKAAIPIEEYLRTRFEDLDREYVDGVVVERPAAPFEHGLLLVNLGSLFRQFRRAHSFWVCPGVCVRTAPERCRIPDLAIYQGARPKGPVPDTPPYVAIEILSPDDTSTRMREKLQEYRSMGVAHIWVIDPYARAISEFGSDGLRDVRSMAMPELGVEFTPDEVFAELDEETGG